uniref:Activin_recp domain-containing protein n=1 Tax=Dracunculus medinensis TaxID=318479 RepID=A0A0N4UI25_DRAME
LQCYCYGTFLSSFCLMNLPPSFKHQIENECWPESSGGGLQCMCAADFCNEGVNKKLRFPDDIPIKNANLLKQNPFLVSFESSSNENEVYDNAAIVFGASDNLADLPLSEREREWMVSDIDNPGTVIFYNYYIISMMQLLTHGKLVFDVL